MPRLIFKNNFEVALAQPTTTSDTTITIRSGSGFPTLAANERVVATIVDAATGLQFEIITVTAVVGDVLTVQRAQEGTAARAWAAGDMLSIRTTAATLTGTVRNFGVIPNGVNLNALNGSWFGQYYQLADSGASISLNYPVAQAGILEVLQTGVSTNGCVQRYTPYNTNTVYQRLYNAITSTWSDWVQVYNTQSVIPVANGGTGQTTIQGMKSAFGFGTVADQNIVPTSMGGTGSADNAQAWLNIRPQGSTPLAGDPVNDYDAATKRWVENLVNTGTVGPSMNGVMNYGVGDFHLRDSRAYIQPYEVVADGQLLNRADWPELWAYAQMLSPIADADWLADPAKRGKYSLGNGTTTFRVPDRNGVQTGSIQALFGRGDGGNSSANGVVSESGAPNITYSAPHTMVTLASAPSQVATNGAFQSITSGDSPAAAGSGSRFIQTNFDASRSSPVYGRSAAEIVPRNFVGVWVIRASGGFVAANTTWSVINGDAVKPATGTLVRGGSVKSEYKIGTNIAYQAFLQAYGKIDGLTSEQGAVISNGVQEWKFAQDGTFYFPNSINQIGTERTDGALNVNAYLRPKDLVAQPLNSVGVAAYESNGMRMINFNQSTPGYVSYFSGDWYAGSYTFGGVRGTGTDLMHAQISINNGQGAAADFKFMPDGTATAGNWVSTSDERVKTNIQRISDPLGKMRLIKGVTWERLDKSEKPNGIGFIAQDVEGVFPDAVKTLKYSNTELKDGTVVEDIKSVDTYGVAAALHHEAILALMDQIDELKAEIAALKAAK
ncbi:tail fiber protein [Escherichia phage FEC19]|uniref:Tail fiber protein n=1 Tax=Escherichia phage FEC19 TaxID=2315486 RepID=A0A386KJM6_9CAUD|nr:tail fiber protein [Escherichia phage FEC19]AYD85516.1 tail fiber protein [Escherichia phage FEC19]